MKHTKFLLLFLLGLTCASAQIINPGGSSGGGTVTQVTGTANQVGVATGTTTPVISITNPFTFPGTVSNDLSIFGATTSAQFLGVISDETGSGKVVGATSPTLVTPVLGAATATSINKVAFTAPTTAATEVFGTDNATITFQGTDTYTGRATTDTFTNKTFDTAGTGNVFKINGVTISANTGTGSNVLATSPTLVTPVLGVATATSVNGTGIPTTTTGVSAVNLYTEALTAGNVTTSNTSAVNMFTGYTLPASQLTAGHRLVITGCWKHSTGSTSALYSLVFGASTTNVQSASTGTGPICIVDTIVAVDGTHQTEVQFTSNTPAGATVFAVQQNFFTQTLSGTLAINFNEATAGSADQFTGYLLTVDLL